MNTTPPVLHPETKPGPIALTVSDLARSVDYYTERLGLRLHAREGRLARLGVGQDDLLLLHEHPGAQRRVGTTGLYHFALLLPSRVELSRALRQLIESRTQLQGASDHLVSEAIYLADPDGNGIEIYRDRPREEWTFDATGLRMATNPLDLERLLSESQSGESWDGLAAGTIMGHVHLHVAGIAEAERFYRDVIGFDLMTKFGGSASFFSAGGYHHHLAVNTWAGVGAPKPPVEAIGLREWSLILRGDDEVRRVAARAREAGVRFDESGDGVRLADPSGNVVRLRTA
jgi:catechol 2,3-dioxygenase